MDRPVIFIHGFGGFADIWRWQVEYFSCRRKVIAIDLPGHGSRLWNGEGLEAMARMLHCDCEREGVLSVEVDLVASSFGGLVAIKFAELFPEQVRRIVFAGSLPKFLTADGYPAGLDQGRIHKLAKQCEGDVRSVLDMFFRSVCTMKERESLQYSKIRELRSQAPDPSREALLGILDMLEKEDLRRLLIQLSKPCLFLLGESDPICPLTVVGALRLLGPLVQVEVLKGTGHFPFLTVPEVFNRRVERFFQ